MIIIGFIPTPEGWAAIHCGIEEARIKGGRLVVVNASKGDAPIDLRRAGEQEIAAIRRDLEASGVEHDIVQPVRRKEAAEEIIDAAEEHRADLIVIGIRRRSPVGKLIMGSTAQRVLIDANCPVLAVKGASQ